MIYQQTLKDKVKQLANMDDELDMYRQQVQLFKDELTTMDMEMKRVKKKYFKIKANETRIPQ